MPDGNLNNVGNGYLYAGDVDGDGLQDKITMWSGSERNNEQGYINVQFMTGSVLWECSQNCVYHYFFEE